MAEVSLRSIVRRLGFALAALAPLATAELSPARADGGWDSRFGSSGIAALPALDGIHSVYSRVLLTQPDGRILVFGSEPFSNSVYGHRLHADGSLDPTFGFEDSIPPPQVQPVAGTVLPDGRIFLATMQGNFTNATLAAWMIMPNGTVDVSFGDAGLVSYNLPFTADSIRAVAPGPNGTLYVAADGEHVTQFGTWIAMAVLRLEADGDPDPSWNISGVVTRNWRTNPVEGDTSRLFAIAPESDGGLLLGGWFWNPTLGTDHAAVGRLTPTGAFDSGFGTSGRKFFRWTFSGYPTSGSLVKGLSRLADDSILVAGSYVEGGSELGRLGTARLTPIGGTDTEYGSDGLAFHKFGDAYNSLAGFSVDAAGRAVLAGTYHIGSFDYAAGAARVLPNGDPDLRWNGLGYSSYIVGGTEQGAIVGVALQSDGGVLLLGDAQSDTAGPQMLVHRFDAGLPFRDGFEHQDAWFWSAP